MALNALQQFATTAMNVVDFPFLEPQRQESTPAAQPTPAVDLPPPPQRESSAPTWQTASATPQLELSQLPVPQTASEVSVSRSPAPQAAIPSIVSASTQPSASAQTALPQGQIVTSQTQVPQTQLPPLSASDATQADPNTQRKRGRPRKYFDEESKRVAEAERRKRKKTGNNEGDDSSDDGESDVNALLGGGTGTSKKEERRPYLHYQMDFGKYDNTKPGALTARDVVVNWLADGTNFKDWLMWSMEKKNEIAQTLRLQLKEHGMLDRDIISVKQQITFLMRGCEEAKKFEKEKIDEPLSTFNSTKVSYLTNRGIPPGQAYIEHTWPFYPKLKDAVADVSVPMPVTRPPRPPRPAAASQLTQARSAQMSGSNYIPTANLDTLDYSALDSNLDPALGGSLSGEPLQADVLAVTSWANHLLSEESRRRQTSSRSLFADMDDEEKVKVLREKEKWELEKMQIRQKLELEKEQMKIKDKNAERETHIQSILVFRDLLKDGLTKNQAGRVVWRDQWPAIKASVGISLSPLRMCHHSSARLQMDADEE
ncbi:hypothetical protein QFC19_003897 [Naganishia cerealis]|uniref:Uncharacterized protein n=1 Tax=Naganishia cerealis TaxID=610337 RepID=A0ACC2W1M1_9TREE|nr:hypothetical protein QFC19_003897 [Naganishia cerealis]